MTKTFTRQDEAHYVIYRNLSRKGIFYAYDFATEIMADLRAAGLTVTKRAAQVGEVTE